MAEHSSIEWTEATWNPVTGCTKVSPGCDNCYAERLAERLLAMGNPRYRNGFDVTLHEDQLTLPLRWRQPKLVFVNSMSDLFHPKVPTDFIQQVFAVMAEVERHTFQVLTKRPKRVAALAEKLPWPDNVWIGTSIESQSYVGRADDLRRANKAAPRREWVRSIRDQCIAAGVPFFFKQWGGRTPKAGGRTLDGEIWGEMPARREPEFTLL
jgi:protein gp37